MLSEKSSQIQLSVCSEKGSKRSNWFPTFSEDLSVTNSMPKRLILISFAIFPLTFSKYNYFQSSQILFHFLLGEKLSTKETLPSWLVWCPEVTGLCLSPGVWRGTLLTLTPPWPPQCWALRQAFSWSLQWTIPTMGNTPAEQRTLQEFPHILQNLKSMVKRQRHWK